MQADEDKMGSYLGRS